MHAIPLHASGIVEQIAVWAVETSRYVAAAHLIAALTGEFCVASGTHETDLTVFSNRFRYV